MCELCGKRKAEYTRPYRYDSGEVTFDKVCYMCTSLYSELIKGGK